jgi:hypothetical protein
VVSATGRWEDVIFDEWVGRSVAKGTDTHARLQRGLVRISDHVSTKITTQIGTDYYSACLERSNAPKGE